MQREINVQEMGKLLEGYNSRKVSMSISPIWSENTYQKFAYDLYDTDDRILFYDRQSDVPQELHIVKDNIEKILYMPSDSVFETVFTIVLKEGRIDFCLDEKRLRCCKCKKVVNLNPMETVWKISGSGNYGSVFENESLELSLCDNCLATLLGCKDDCDCDCENSDLENGLDKEKTCH